MKRTLSALVLSAAMLGAFGLAQPAFAGGDKKAAAPAKAAAAKASYECPKCHAKSDKPGKCAKCKVALVKAEAGAKKTDASAKDDKGAKKGDKGAKKEK